MPAEVTEQEFKEFPDLNKINYVKPERLTSKKDRRVLKIFKLETKDDTEAEALITENLTCPITGIIMHSYERINQIPKIYRPNIMPVSETGFKVFEVDQCEHCFGHNSVDL